MSWKDRLQSNIIFVSPGGTQFEAQWTGNTRTLEKKVGIFTYPKIPGVIVQDLDVGGVMYPLTMYFEGADHDITANQFLEACKENGAWDITHPVRGLLSLQLLSVSEEIEPVESGNITKINTEWIEPTDESITPSSQQIASSIFSQSDTVNASALGQFETAFQDTYSEVAAIRETVDTVVDKVKKTLSPIYESAAGINSRITSIQRSIQDFITQPAIDLAGVAGQIQNLFQLPILAVEDTLHHYGYGNSWYKRTRFDERVLQCGCRQRVVLDGQPYRYRANSRDVFGHR
jgi:prophage DNA circulation protein